MKSESDKFSELESLSDKEYKNLMAELNRQLEEIWSEIERDPWIQSCLDIDMDE